MHLTIIYLLDNTKMCFDGLSDQQEINYFNDYVIEAQSYITDQNVVSQIFSDPSADNYNYYRDDDYDAQVTIKKIDINITTILEGNSPTSEMSDTMNSDGYLLLLQLCQMWRI